MKISKRSLRNLLVSLVVAPAAIALTAAPAHAAPGGLGDGTGDGLADIWYTVDSNHYSGGDSNSVNGRTWFGARVKGDPYMEFQWNERVGLGDASAMVPLPDVNADHRSDMMVRFGSHMFLYYGAGNGKLTKGPEIGHGWDSRDQLIYAGELNGDGVRYLVGRGSTDGRLYAYKFLAGGAVSSVGEIGHGWGKMRFILGPGQMVGDKKADIVGIDVSGNMWCYRGLGGGAIATVGQCGSGWNAYRAAFVPGDLDGDGLADLVGVATVPNANAIGEPVVPKGQKLSDVSMSSRAPMYMFRNQGNGTWGTRQQIGHDNFMFRLFA